MPLPMLGMREYILGGLFNKSRSVTETILNTETINKNTSSQLQQNISKTVNTTTTMQSLNVKFKARNMLGANEFGPGCVQDYTQKANISQNIPNEVMAQQLSNMSTDVANEMAANFDQAATTGSIALADISTNDKKNITEQIKNVVERSMTQENIAETLNNTINITEGKLEIDLEGDCAAPVKYTQELIVDTAVTNTIDAVVEAISEDKTLSEMTQDIAQKLETKGVIGETGEFLKDAGTGLASAAKGVGEGVGTAGKGVGEGVGTAAKGVGEGVGSAFGGGTSASIAIAIVLLILLGVAAYFMMG